MALFRKTPRNPEEIAGVKLEIEKLRDAFDRQEERTRAAEHRAVDDRAVAPRDPELEARLEAVVAQLDALDSRVTAVSTELANQLSELGNDIESLQQRGPGEPVDEEMIGEIRDGQERLANEQARYQIAFRADLARLAEQLRRPRP